METQFFKEIPFFSHLNDEQITQLAQAFQPRKFKKDDVIIQKGDKPDGMYVIVFGTVEVKLDDKHIKQLKGNQFFGEIALITSEPRTATVKANSEDLLTLYLQRKFSTT